MRSESIGTPAASRSIRDDAEGKRAGFTLIEALVALALVVAFAAVLGPCLFQARRIIADTQTRVAAQVLLRSLVDAPFDRSQLANASRDGEIAGLHWHIAAEPMTIDTSREPARWTAFRVITSVSWGGGQIVTAETVRLAKAE
jgi:prepilin-type N-terminal cleavage/methylation domain-containing protein